MKKNISITTYLAVCFILLVNVHLGQAIDITLNNSPVKVYFSPRGGCTEAIVDEIDHAKSEIYVQAYSFTSAPIAKALVNESCARL
jgi:hypothetical protein